MIDDSTARRLGGAISRRDLLATIAPLGILSSLFPGLLAGSGAASEAAGAAPPLGLQLYTLRNLLAQDFAGTIEQLAAIGYKEVELYDGLYERDAREMRAVLDRFRLKAPGGHFALERLEDRMDRVVADATALGHRYVIVPSIDQARQTPAGYADLAVRFTRFGKSLASRRLRLGYHNHGYDVLPLEGGRSGLEILLDETPPGVVTFELDLFWARQGGADIAAFFRRYPGRFRLVHVKDMAPDGSQADVGAGTMDWPVLLAAARRAGVRHWFIEHDEPKDPLAFARVSYHHLRPLRW